MRVALTIIPILISLAAFALALHAFRQSRPRWHVSASTATLFSESTGAVTPSLLVVVTNVGRAPGAIQAVAVHASDGTYSVRHHPSNTDISKGSKLPAVLAPTENRTWIFDLGKIRTALSRRHREFAPMLQATVESGLTKVSSAGAIWIGPLPAPPAPFARVPKQIRPLVEWTARRVQQRRMPHPQLVGAVFLNGNEVARGTWTVPVRNFGKGTARNLRLDRVRVQEDVETRVEDVPVQQLRRLRSGKSHEFVYPLEQATKPTRPGVQYYWRLHIGNRRSGVMVSVTSREQAHEILTAMRREAAQGDAEVQSAPDEGRSGESASR